MKDDDDLRVGVEVAIPATLAFEGAAETVSQLVYAFGVHSELDGRPNQRLPGVCVAHGGPRDPIDGERNFDDSVEL